MNSNNGRTDTETDSGTANPHAGKVYQLKVTVAGSDPPIWRRVLVPADSTLADLHEVCQAIMGWHNSHLHEFRAPGLGKASLRTNRSRQTARRFVPTMDPLGGPLGLFLDDDDCAADEAAAYLNDVAPSVKAHFIYIYDMGDNWEHDIVVEKILPADLEGIYPICVAGERNGPLEDSGGIGGYEDLLVVLADPSHPEHREIKSWLREVFGVRAWDGEAFDLDRINKKLKWMQPKRRRSTRTVAS